MSKTMSGFPSMPATWAGSNTRRRELRSVTPRTLAGAGLLSGALLLLVLLALSPAPVANSQARASAPLARTGFAVGAVREPPLSPLPPSRPFTSPPSWLRQFISLRANGLFEDATSGIGDRGYPLAGMVIRSAGGSIPDSRSPIPDPRDRRESSAGLIGPRHSLRPIEPRDPRDQRRRLALMAPIAPIAPADVITNNWTNLYPTLHEVSAVSATEAWAVGEYGHLLHYTGGSWTAVDPPIMSGLPLYDISMASAKSGWITWGGGAFRYDGANWSDASAGLDSANVLFRVAAATTSDAWGIGFTCGRTSCANAYLHWNGTTWSAGPVLPAALYLYDISMSSGTVGWATGSERVSLSAYAPYVARYDGTSWTRVAAPSGALALGGVLSVGPTDAWITGYDDNFQGQIYHYSGGTWIAYSTGPNVALEMYMHSPTEGWAVTGDSILHWNGASWLVEYAGRSLASISGAGRQVWAVGWASTILNRGSSPPWTLQRGGPTTNWLFSVSAVSPTEAWAVGESGTVLHYYSSTWQLVPTTFNDFLFDVHMLSANEGYAVGDHIIARWDGTSWTRVASPGQALVSVNMAGSGDGWAVGENGVIWRGAGGAWLQVSSPVTRTLYTVAMDSPGHGWAGGGDAEYAGGRNVYHPVLLEYAGGAWVDRSATQLPPGSPILDDMALSPGGAEGWAVGDPDYSNLNASAVLRLRNGVWALDTTSETYSSLASVAPEATGEAWAIGCGDYRHYVGATWQYRELPTSWCGISLYNSLSFLLPRLTIVPGRGGWAVGEEGELFRYDPLADGRRFYDVPLDNPFYTFIEYMAAHSIVSGYSDNSFRPNATATRSQLCKIVVLAEGWEIYTPPSPTFRDVPDTHTFYQFIETAFNHGIISGYGCGPACLEFRPGNNVTRAQLCKIVVLAEGWEIYTPPTPTFRDVPDTDPFYALVETAYNHGIISGYTCGAGCLEFRPGNNATRGQISKIVYLAATGP